MDRDGDYDIGVNRSGGAGVAVLINDGNGGFFSQSTLDCVLFAGDLPACSCHPQRTTRRPGLGQRPGPVVSKQDEILFYKNQGGKSFVLNGSLPVSGIFRLGDMDLDGYLDSGFAAPARPRSLLQRRSRSVRLF